MDGWNIGPGPYTGLGATIMRSAIPDRTLRSRYVGQNQLGLTRPCEYVITDEAGTPVHPEWYSDEFGRLLRRAGLRRITLHDSRHTTLTLMEHAGVPISIISKWAGHYDSALTQKTYVHASDEDLQRGQAALARIRKIAWKL